MPKKQKTVTVTVTMEHAPDARQRLARIYQILLRDPPGQPTQR